MDTLLQFFVNSPEVRGWHFATAITVVINILTLNQACATAGQVRRIYSCHSISGVSVVTMSFYCFYFMAFLCYGIAKGSLNMVLSGSQCILYIPLLLGMWKFGDVKCRKTMKVGLPLFALIPVIMYLTEWKETFLLMLFGAILVTIWLMHTELKRARGVGCFEIKFAVAFLANAIFWFLYGISLHDMPLMIFNPFAVILLLMIISLYFKKKAAITS